MKQKVVLFCTVMGEVEMEADMTYTIAQAAERTGLTAHTLRYYDKEGLTPYVKRDPAGNRAFEEKDFKWLELINCLKKSGMPIKQIREYVLWSIEGDSTLEIRLEMMKEHKKSIEKKLAELQGYMDKVEHKIWYYETAVTAGTERIHDKQEAGTDMDH